MKTVLFSALVLTLSAGSHWSGREAIAASIKLNKSGRTVTVTRTNAKLVGSSTQASAKGFAEYASITVAKSSSNTTTTNSHLIVHVRHLKLADSTEVTFEHNGAVIGTGTVHAGRVMLHLTTVAGDTVPAIAATDSLTVLETTGSISVATGTFGTVTTETRPH